MFLQQFPQFVNLKWTTARTFVKCPGATRNHS